MIRVRQIKINVKNDGIDKIYDELVIKLHINRSDITDLKIVKKSIDARKKDKVCFIYEVDVCVSDISKIVFGNDVFIGANVFVLDGVHISDGAVVGAGAVVTKDVPEWCVAAGNPCRVIRKITEEDRNKYFAGKEIDEEALEHIQRIQADENDPDKYPTA